MEVYANYTGFLWETAKDFKALVVFAEVICSFTLLVLSCLMLLPFSSVAEGTYVQHTLYDCVVPVQHGYYGKSQPLGALLVLATSFVHVIPEDNNLCTISQQHKQAVFAMRARITAIMCSRMRFAQESGS